MYTPEDIDDLLQSRREGETLEFKSAKSNFDSRDRADYCAAIANMGGGKLLLGITDNRTITGTAVYDGTISKVPNEVFQATGVTVTVQEILHSKGRVVVFTIPPRPTGKPAQSNGQYRYPIRRGESLGEMTEDELRVALNELVPDFSANIVHDVSLPNDIDPVALQNFRTWRCEKMGNTRPMTDSVERLLADAELTVDGQCTLACLVLLGTEEKVRRLVPQAEIIYEWRTREGQTNYDFRKEWRGPYFGVYDDIWETINARNLRTPFQEGFIQREIWAFDEKACREAVNNAVAHRDYSITSASIFILASPDKFSIVSPGGFLSGISPENILTHAPKWRNRRIASTMQQTKLVERSGQGMDDIFETSIRQGKGLPDFEGTDDTTVRCNIPARVRDPGFIRFLERVTNEQQIIFSFDELYELEQLRERKILASLRHKEKFFTMGIIEKVGKTSGIKYMLSHRYYTHQERPGVYTRIKGLNRSSKKQLILEHINKQGQAKRDEFVDAFPDLKSGDISNLLSELKNDGKIRHIGSRKFGYWEIVSN